MLLEAVDQDSGTVVDCFAGSGVTGTAARSSGLSFRGIEAHPFVAELASLKFPTSPNPDGLRIAANRVVEGVKDEASAVRAAVADIEGEVDLIQRSFAKDVLQTLVALRAAIRQEDDATVTLYLKWALLSTLRDVAAVKVGWPYQRPALSRQPVHKDPIARFATRVAWMADDLELLDGTPTDAAIVVGDARQAASWADITATSCVSSPPYLNNFDYADATRLELYFWGEVRSWKAMTDSVRKDMLTATTQQSSRGEQADATAVLSGLEGFGPKLQVIREQLATERKARGSGGKQYDQVVGPYFHAMLDVLRRLHSALEPNSPAVWLIGDSAPYGVYVDTPALIGELAETVGFVVESDVIARHRGRRWAGTVRHEHALTERVLVFRKV
jgi:hypothetical protein